VNPPEPNTNAQIFCLYFSILPGFRLAVTSFALQRTTVVAHLNASTDRPPLCFTGHLHTGPLGTAPWRKKVFAEEIERDRLYGRGSIDMKAGLAAMRCLPRFRLLNGADREPV